jgi:hypothetical protein
VLTRALVLFALVAAVTAVAVLKLVPLPEIPLLRYVVYAMPLVGAVVVVREWLAAGAPSPLPVRQASKPSRPTRTAAGARIVQERSISAR